MDIAISEISEISEWKVINRTVRLRDINIR